jgi:hypothetical protein
MAPVLSAYKGLWFTDESFLVTGSIQSRSRQAHPAQPLISGMPASRRASLMCSRIRTLSGAIS